MSIWIEHHYLLETFRGLTLLEKSRTNLLTSSFSLKTTPYGFSVFHVNKKTILKNNMAKYFNFLNNTNVFLGAYRNMICSALFAEIYFRCCGDRGGYESPPTYSTSSKNNFSFWQFFHSFFGSKLLGLFWGPKQLFLGAT